MKKRPSRNKASAQPKSVAESKSAAHAGSAQPGPSRESGEDTPAPQTLSTKQKVAWLLIVLLVYAVVGTWGHFDFGDLMGYYNYLADAFLQGRTYIQPTPEQVYLHDMIPYENRYYLQWGPFPALFHATAKLVGLKLSDRVACMLAALLNAAVFLAIIVNLRRRFFPTIPNPVLGWFFFAFALATPTVLLGLRGTVYHESAAVGGLGILWSFFALLRYQETLASRWAIAIGAGVAIAALSRISLIVYGVGLAAAVGATLYARRGSTRKAIGSLALAGLPIVAAGLLTMAYNQARFGSPWDFGRFYLPSTKSADSKAFAVRNMPENLRNYLLAAPKWTPDFPWIEHVGWEPLEYTNRAEDTSSLLITSPFVLLAALCWPVWRRGRHDPRLRIFTIGTALSSLLMFVIMLSLVASARRYAQDFFPLWVILAFVGIGLYGVTASQWRRWKAPARALLTVSFLVHAHISFTQSFTWDPPDLNVMRTFATLTPAARKILPAGPNWDQHEAVIRNDLGSYYLNSRQPEAALKEFERASDLMPEDARIRKNLELARRLARGG